MILAGGKRKNEQENKEKTVIRKQINLFFVLDKKNFK
jgi:hypothetical protein